MSRFRIRQYAPGDWATVQRIHDGARMCELQKTVGIDAFRSLSATADEEGLFDGDLWVAEDITGVIGFVAYDRNEVSWLYVDPGRHREGIGRRLLEHALSRIGGDAETSVLNGNDPALNLYLAMGFQIVETKAGHLSGSPHLPAVGLLLRRNWAAQDR